MIVIPAFDLKKGNVVRLFRGLYNKETIYSPDPVQVAKKWEKDGAEFLHIIDLDGAFFGEPKNLAVVEKIVKEVNLKVHFGGGIRSEETVKKVLSIGAHKVIMSTKIFEDSSFIENIGKNFAKKIIVSIDAKAGIVLDRGWTNQTELTVEQALKKVEAMGIRMAVLTDISCDGALSGPNIGLLEDVLSKTKIDIIASGGVSSLADIKAVSKLEKNHKNLLGIICGKALYEGRFKLKEAIDCAS
ncbi:MAG: 1-(5-phosphoribosyl)-5-[(5-phosphoribosylamino)methylideneamino]imidazole-4-carboxamide isomerase [Candidatus Omnitrophica bacterium]|nr:1-(5-phosphoribosyl)-5-[(5-phosphoribosylamino)methylideneamino]imidazole-4-carboxamide isomerase [Candidatus Omnitrophota bacterium]